MRSSPAEPLTPMWTALTAAMARIQGRLALADGAEPGPFHEPVGKKEEVAERVSARTTS